MQRCAPYISSTLSNSRDATKLMALFICSWSTSIKHPTPSVATTRSPLQQDTTMCLERISAVSYLTMAAHPDGSPRAFFSTQDGKVWLASVPRRGSGSALLLRDRGPFLDLTDRVSYNPEFGFGLKGVAFHPDFATNGRFFVSYTRDSGAAGKCWSAAPAAGNGSRPSCRYHLVVDEFSAKDGAGVEDYHKAAPSEVRSIFRMVISRPHRHYSYQQHGAQLLFKPRESYGYLYLITGHGAYEDARGRALDSSKNKSLFSKIIRIDVDSSTPKMEIFAMGVSNPSGCSFDGERPSSFYCANVDEQHHERVYLISKGGNYGGSSSEPTLPFAINHGRPADGVMPSIIGGLVYHGSADAALNGRYIYMYASCVWTGEVGSSGSKSNVSCSGSSPVPCHRSGGCTGISGRVLFLGEDNSKDLFILATGGVYRLVPPSLCKIPPPQLPQWPAGTSWLLTTGAFALMFTIYLIFSTIFGGGQTLSFLNPSIHLTCCFIDNRTVTSNHSHHRDE